MTIDASFTSAVVDVASAWLLHATWQAALIGAMAWLLLAGTRQHGPEVRYAVAFAALASMPVVPTLTIVAHRSGATPTFLALLPVDAVGAVLGGWSAALPALAPVLVVVWFSGVLVWALRLGLSWRAVCALASTEVLPLPPEWCARLSALASTMGVTTPVRLWQSTRIEVPCVAGWLRPVILMPSSVLTGLAPWQIEAVLAHELAHIRRHDPLMNLVQVVVEALLYFHPAVRWLSRVVRVEREHCCDDLALTVYASRSDYARALTDLEQLRGRVWQPALGATDGHLLTRIRRILAPSSAPRDKWRASIALRSALALLVVCAAITVAPAPASSAPSLAIAQSPALLVAMLLGFSVGLRHALEPDHLATVATMVSRERSAWTAAQLGATWGLGHTLSLVTVGLALLVLQGALPGAITTAAEGAVALMLVAFGGKAVRNALLMASTGPMVQHSHGRMAHAHAVGATHVHVGRLTLARRPLLVGIVHGLAGSGSLTALAVAQLPTPVARLAFLVVFALGSTAAMAALSGCAGWPLARFAANTRLTAMTSLASGVASILLAALWSVPRLASSW